MLKAPTDVVNQCWRLWFAVTNLKELLIVSDSLPTHDDTRWDLYVESTQRRSSGRPADHPADNIQPPRNGTATSRIGEPENQPNRLAKPFSPRLNF